MLYLQRYKKYMTLITACCILLAMVQGCGRLLRPQEQKEDSGEQKKEAPKALTQIEEITNSLIQDIEKVREQRARQQREQEQPSKEEPRQQGQADNQGTQGGQGDQNSEQTEQQEGENGGQGKQQDQGGQAQQQGAREQKPKESPVPQVNWNDFEKSVEELHVKWNNVEPQFRTDGASRDAIADFEERLNTFTEMIIARNEDNALVAANRLYGAIPGFLNLYKHKQPPEVKEIKFNVRQIIINGREDKWEETDKVLNEIKKAWQTAKSRMAKPDKNLNARIDDAIEDFSHVAIQKKINLVRLKGNILIENLDKIK